MLIPLSLNKALKHFPEKEAVVCGDHRFTYRLFGERVYGLAHYFMALGLGKGDHISMLHANSHHYLEAYYAAAQIGAVLNPLNFRLSPRELSYIIAHSESKILIAHRDYEEQVMQMKDMLQEHSIHLIWSGQGTLPPLPNGKDYEQAIAESERTPVPVPDMNDETVAHLYYTSGTTGKPKGVMLTHKNVMTHALSAIAELHLTDRDVWIHVAPLFHLADAWATFAITLAGGRHILVERFDPLAVLQTMEREKVTLSNMIPTMLNMLINHPQVSEYDYSSLRVLLSGGAPIAPEVVRRIVETFGCDYIQTYGMTETSPYLTVSILKEHLKKLPYEKQLWYKSRTGREFMGVELKVIDDKGEEIAPDDQQVGEIIVRGDIVTPGYWKMEEETAASIENGWLHTGDLATIEPEGYVNIVDRKKDMIVTGGENVYSTEVENVLYEHPSILEAAVFGVPDPKWGEAVKAAVVLKSGQSATEEDIIQFCKEKIAHYKAPKSIDFLKEIPKTGSGKIFKKGLRDSYWSKEDKRVR